LNQTSEVLARKYRPKKFEDVIGQDSVSNTLSLALDTNRLSHAYLFSGLRGSGKTSTARIFSKALLCEKGPTSKPCEVCQNCTMSNDNRHIDIIELDAASNRKIDDIRDIIEQSKYKPAIARYKIFIIDEVHMLTKEAFNALLKTLEEPPEFVKFILATTDPLKLPATILSRTQHFRFKSISKSSVLNHLEFILNKEQIPFEVDALDIIARSGNGSLRDTLTILDQAIIYSKKRVDVASVTDMLGLIDPAYLDELFGAIFDKDTQKIKSYIHDLDTYDAETVIDEMCVYLKDKLLDGNVKYSVLVVDRFFRVLSDAKHLLSINADNSFVMILTMLKMVEALKIKDINEMIEDLENNISKNHQQQKKIPEVKIDTTQKEVAKPIDTSVEKFEKLVMAIYDRNTDIGDCFKNSITFISYEDGVLSWSSDASDDCKKRLKVGYSVIKHLVQEIFGIETKINLVQSKKNSNVETNKTPKPPQVIEPQETIQPQDSIVESISMPIEVDNTQMDIVITDDTNIQNIEPQIVNEPQESIQIEPTQVQENIEPKIDTNEPVDNSLVIGSDTPFSSVAEVEKHDTIKAVKDIFGSNVSLYVKKTDKN
jgi:DNA polymerase-3 subunit gamma/tau